MRRIQAAVVCLAVFWLSACSTTSTQGYRSAGGSKEEALQSYTGLGLQYLRAGDTASAKRPLLHALDLDDNYAPAFNGLALVFQAEDDLALAEEYFRKAVAADPQSAMIHNNFGAFLFAQRRYDEACRELARATEDPFYQQRAQAFENLGRCYRQIGRLDVAEHAFRRALTLSRQRPVALIELADLLLMKEQSRAAGELFDRFRELVDDKRVDHFPLSLWVGIRVARYEGNAGRAATYALLLKNMYPESAEYRLYKESAQ
jgi:type IV pilus assembly protein PilF